jgi:hypothetical protein
LLQKKPTTIFHLASREISSSSLEFIERLLTVEDREKAVNEKLFDDRDSIKDAIAKECKKTSKLLTN